MRDLLEILSELEVEMQLAPFALLALIGIPCMILILMSCTLMELIGLAAIGITFAALNAILMRDCERASERDRQERAARAGKDGAR